MTERIEAECDGAEMTVAARSTSHEAVIAMVSRGLCIADLLISKSGFELKISGLRISHRKGAGIVAAPE